MPKLIIQHDRGREERELGPRPLSLGRSSSNDIVVEDHQASREHCRIEFEDGKWYVVDLGSSNGTLVDNQPVTRQELVNGSLIGIGSARISFADEAAPEPDLGPSPTEPQPVPPGLELHATGGPCDGRTFPIEKTVTRIGRSPASDIVLDESGVSKLHAELIVDEHGVRIVDKNSRNGVHVNQARVDERELQHGDHVCIGSTSFLFVSGEGELAAAAGEAEEAPSRPAAGPTAAGILTRRVKIIGGVVLLILVAGIINKLAGPSAKKPKEHEGNLLENPSFEQRRGSGVAAWKTTKGSVSLDEENAVDGAVALRLVSLTAAGDDVSALSWSSEIPVGPGRQYVFSASVRNSESESAALSVAWLDKKRPWLRNIHLGEPINDASDWRRVEETFESPSWATSARFGCAVIGQGAPWFDGLCLLPGDGAARPKQVSAGRVALEASPRGEFVVLADQTPLFARGRAAAMIGEQRARQTVGTLKKGYPDVRPRMIQVVGAMGPDHKLPFTQVISTDRDRIRLHYDIDTSRAAGASVFLELVSKPGLVQKGMTIETADADPEVEKAPFDKKPGVARITFFSGKRRVFLELSRPTDVSATAEEADGSVTWRLEFPARSTGGSSALTLLWSAIDRDKADLLAGELASGAEAVKNQELGKAVKIFREFLDKYRLYAEEREEAEAQLKRLTADISKRITNVAGLAKKARLSQAPEDYTDAENAYAKLIGVLEGHLKAEALRATLKALRREREALTKKKEEDAAAKLVAQAKPYIDKADFDLAEILLNKAIREHPKTDAATQARQLLSTFPKRQ